MTRFLKEDYEVFRLRRKSVVKRNIVDDFGTIFKLSSKQTSYMTDIFINCISVYEVIDCKAKKGRYSSLKCQISEFAL